MPINKYGQAITQNKEETGETVLFRYKLQPHIATHFITSELKALNHPGLSLHIVPSYFYSFKPLSHVPRCTR